MQTQAIKFEPKDVWFVWTRTGHRPTYAHKDEARARAEAQRLAALYPGKKFIVMQCCGKYSAIVRMHEGELRASEKAKLAEAVALVNELNGRN